jgi:hypothetical protein
LVWINGKPDAASGAGAGSAHSTVPTRVPSLCLGTGVPVSTEEGDSEALAVSPEELLPSAPWALS